MSTPSSPESQLTLSVKQALVFHCPARFRVVVAGRRFGKTSLALFEMLRAASSAPHRLIWYVGPNDRQSKRIVWDRLKTITRPYWRQRPNESERRIHFKNASTIVVNGAFHPDSLRGVGLDLLILDEFASIKSAAWREVFRPALADRQGRALFIGTPKGRNHFYDHFEFAHHDPDWRAFHFSTAEGGFVPPAELLSAARELDPLAYRQEFDAEFINAGQHRVYYAFARGTHVQPLTYDPSASLAWAIDFNVNPMSMLIAQRSGDTVYVLDEIILSDGHTEAACQAFLARVQALISTSRTVQRLIEIEVYGDSSGHQKRTSASQTDWTIVREFFSRWRGTFQPVYRFTAANPPVRDRVNCVNRRLQTQSGEARLFINGSCRELIKDLEQVSWALDSTGAVTSYLDKSDHARTHTSDALGYFIAQAFPLKPLIGPQPTGRLL